MFRTIVFLSALAIGACSNTSGLAPKVSHSGFDNSKVVNIAPHGNACTYMTCTGFGLQWNSKYPDDAFMIVQVFNNVTPIFGAQLNIDGDIITLKESQLVSSYDVDGYTRNSSKAFSVSLETLESIENANRVWMRVETPDGTIEDAIIENGKDSKSYHALKRFLLEVKS